MGESTKKKLNKVDKKIVFIKNYFLKADEVKPLAWAYVLA